MTVQYLGNALAAFQAAPGYELVGPAADPDDVEVFIDLIYLQGYSRWPTDVNQGLNHVPVEGRVQLAYEVFVDGRRVKKGKHNSDPPAFKVPVSIITRTNVAQVVNDSLVHQFDKATTDLLEEFLWDLAEIWPENDKR